MQATTFVFQNRYQGSCRVSRPRTASRARRAHSRATFHPRLLRPFRLCASCPSFCRTIDALWWEHTSLRIHQLPCIGEVCRLPLKLFSTWRAREEDPALRTSHEPETTTSRHASREQHHHAISQASRPNPQAVTLCDAQGSRVHQQHRSYKEKREKEQTPRCLLSLHVACGVCNEVWWRPYTTNLPPPFHKMS